MATTTGQAPLVQTFRRGLPAEGTAGTGGVYVLGVAPFAGHLTRASYLPDVAVTGPATNYKTLQVQNRGATGVGTTIMANLFLTTGQNAPQADETVIPLSGVPANLDFVQGDVIALVSTVTGTGMTLPTGAVEVDLYRD